MNTIRSGIVLCFFLLVLSPVHSVAQVEKIADRFQFVEGPVWKEGLGLLFSDINGNTIYRWSPDSGVVPLVRPSGNANGLAIDAQGRLLAAQQGSRQVVRFEQNGTQTILAMRFEGKRLNSPNVQFGADEEASLAALSARVVSNSLHRSGTPVHWRTGDFQR